MPKIQVLDKQVAELIAAGEVVERPASVIKELVENAVDAGATVITVEIRRGRYHLYAGDGQRLRHRRRGRAHRLPAPRHQQGAAGGRLELHRHPGLPRARRWPPSPPWPHVELLTRTTGAVAGVRYTCGGGRGAHLAKTPAAREGTTILVRDLFYNTPARMKFLKKDSTEGNSVAGILDKLALSHPEISFAVHPGTARNSYAHPGGRQALLHHLRRRTAGSFPPP